MPTPLQGVRIVSMAVNLPGPVAATRLAALGATVTKVEPPSGDPVRLIGEEAYRALVSGQTVVVLDLKSTDGLARLHDLLDDTDVLLTSFRPAALARLGLGWDILTARHPQLSQVAIVGHAGADADRAGHDLTYQADGGLLDGARMPRAPYADLAGAERAVAQVAVAVVDRLLHGRSTYWEVGLADVAEDLGQPYRWGLTRPGGVLGGGLPTYAIYPTSDGHVAVAALEPHYADRLAQSLGIQLTGPALTAAFSSRTSAQWAVWATDNDIPLSVVPAP